MFGANISNINSSITDTKGYIDPIGRYVRPFGQNIRII